MAAKKPGKKPEFGIWFKEQFGNEPGIDQLVRLREEVASLERRLAVAKEKLAQKRRLMILHDAAIKGWIAGYKRGERKGVQAKKSV